ncbi:MAG: PHP domain-containing protein [Oscillospiraceae bacterium]|jgi:predicted metal-dependent phosphoesterase TrpH|nr:PHP domain-containing protein [Oscillospiraceae bacterium]
MIDLHIHTTYSDGSCTISNVLKEAQSKKISTISITDHNTVSAYNELENNEIRSLYKGNIINGCELLTSYNGELIDVLAYNFDMQLMLSYLNANYLTLEQKHVKEAEMIKEIYPKSPLYIDRSLLYPSLDKTLSAIHDVGGVAFLAHTFAYSEAIVSELENIIKEYKIDGFECYHTTFTKEQTQYLLQFCNDYNLFKSGGSDFHGENKINHNMGIGDGSLNINEDLIKDWYEQPQIKK